MTKYKIISVDDYKESIESGLTEAVNTFIEERCRAGEIWVPTGGICVLIPRSGGMSVQDDLRAYQAMIMTGQFGQ